MELDDACLVVLNTLKKTEEKNNSAAMSLWKITISPTLLCANSMQETFSLYWTASANQKKLEAIANITTLPKGTALKFASRHKVTARSLSLWKDSCFLQPSDPVF